MTWIRNRRHYRDLVASLFPTDDRFLRLHRARGMRECSWRVRMCHFNLLSIHAPDCEACNKQDTSDRTVACQVINGGD